MMKNIYQYYKKIETYIFWPVAMLLVIVITSNLLAVVVKAQLGIVQGGVQAGGRIVTVSPCTPPPTLNPLCTAALCTPAPTDEVVILTPYGNSAVQLCIPLTPPLITKGPPVTVASVGGQLLGLFSVVSPLAVAIGIIGTSAPGI